jgi:outer membrane protein assembly factor BamA
MTSGALMRSFIAVILIVFASGFCFAQAPNWYQGKTIRDIRFEGLKHIRLSELDNTLESY